MPPFQSLFLVAHVCTCLLVAAVLVWWRPRPSSKTTAFAIALALVAIAPGWGAWAHRPLPIVGSIAMLPFVAAALLATLATSRPTPTMRTVVAAQGQTLLFGFCLWIPLQDLTLAALHLTWIAALIGLETHAECGDANERALVSRRYPVHDVAVFIGATTLAAVASSLVLERYILSGDEWAYTVQADLFAHGHAYGSTRPCEMVFKNWWVFSKDGRLFAQYTPGWPLVMMPFQRLGVVWLAAPVVTGVCAVAVARLARRFAAAGLITRSSPSDRTVITAGYIAAAALMLSPSMLLNAASRYSHPLVCATWGWALEATCAIAFDEGSRRKRLWLGTQLGTSTALLFATRPGDALALSLPIGAFALLMVLRDRTRLDALIAAALPFTIIGAFTAVILRLQLGEWLKTGYSLAPTGLRPELSLPRSKELGFVLKLDLGAVWWLPCAPATAALVLAAARGRAARSLAAMLGCGWLLLVVMYSLSPLGRDPGESGYGPRMLLPAVLVMAVSTGALAASTLADVARATRVYTPVAAIVLLAGTAYLGSLIYPVVHIWVHDKLALKRAIAAAGLHHAVVVVHEGELAMQAWDETQNLPTDPDPDVLVITDFRAGDDFACAEKRYRDRAWFVGSGVKEVELKPLR